MSNLETIYLAEERLLITQLGGRVTVPEVEKWHNGFNQALAQLEAGQQFKLLVNLTDYDPVDIPTHKAMRDIIPLKLAQYEFRTALLNLFENVDLPLSSTDSITCQAVAHVHHDADKMNEYRDRLGRANEQFFTDVELATKWIKELR